MGPTKVPQRKNKQRGIEKIPDGTNLHNLRLQNRIHWTRIQNRPPWKRDAEDRLPPRIRPEPEKTGRRSKESPASARIRGHPSQSTRIPRTLQYKAIGTNRPRSRNARKDSLRTQPRSSP